MIVLFSMSPLLGSFVGDSSPSTVATVFLPLWESSVDRLTGPGLSSGDEILSDALLFPSGEGRADLFPLDRDCSTWNISSEGTDEAETSSDETASDRLCVRPPSREGSPR